MTLFCPSMSMFVLCIISGRMAIVRRDGVGCIVRCEVFLHTPPSNGQLSWCHLLALGGLNTRLVRLTHSLTSIWSKLACSGTTIWATFGLSESLKLSREVFLDVPFHVIPLVLVIQTKFSCSSSCALAVGAPALLARAIRAITVIFIWLIGLLLSVGFAFSE